MINQHWLNTFCTLVEVGHFTKTADKLFMTQSGVSQHIAKLETQLATALIIREGKTFSLTDGGKILYRQGRIVLRSLDELEQTIKEDDKHQGQLIIASPGSIGLKLYPYLLSIQQQYPQLVVDYIFAPNTDIENKIFERQIDVGLMTQISRRDNVICDEIAKEPLVLVTSAAVDSINWQDLLSLGFISHPDAKHHAQLLLGRNFAEFEHIDQLKHQGFSNQISLICEPVSLGLGFTVLPLHAAKAFKFQQRIRIHHLDKPVYESLYFCVNNNVVMSQRVKFIKTQMMTFLAQR